MYVNTRRWLPVETRGANISQKKRTPAHVDGIHEILITDLHSSVLPVKCIASSLNTACTK